MPVELIKEVSSHIDGMEMWIGKPAKGFMKDVPGHYRHARHRNGYMASLTWSSWYNMVSRCYQPSRAISDKDRSYQEKGIQVCTRWVYGDGVKSGFFCFLEDMGERPSHQYTLSRHGDEGNYMPGNVDWAIQSSTKWKRN